MIFALHGLIFAPPDMIRDKKLKIVVGGEAVQTKFAIQTDDGKTSSRQGIQNKNRNIKISKTP